MSSKFCTNQLYSSYFLGFFITKLYTIFYYLHYFLLFSKVTYYFVWRNLPINNNYFKQIYLLFSVTLIINISFFSTQIKVTKHQLCCPLKRESITNPYVYEYNLTYARCSNDVLVLVIYDLMIN